MPVDLQLKVLSRDAWQGAKLTPKWLILLPPRQPARPRQTWCWTKQTQDRAQRQGVGAGSCPRLEHPPHPIPRMPPPHGAPSSFTIPEGEGLTPHPTLRSGSSADAATAEGWKGGGGEWVVSLSLPPSPSSSQSFSRGLRLLTKLGASTPMWLFSIFGIGAMESGHTPSSQVDCDGKSSCRRPTE